MRYLRLPMKLRETVKSISYRANMLNSVTTGGDGSIDGESLEIAIQEANRRPLNATMVLDDPSVQHVESTENLHNLTDSKDQTLMKGLGMVTEDNFDDKSSLSSGQLIIAKGQY